jgi:hypothetical protein
MRPFVTAFVPPGIYYKKEENYKTEDQKHHGSGFVFPKLLAAFRDFMEIHAGSSYTSRCQNEIGIFTLEN